MSQVETRASIQTVRGLIQAADRLDERFVLHCFTYDSPSVTTDLLEVASKTEGKARFVIYADYDCLNKMEAMKERLGQINQCTRAYVKIAEGIGCGPAYREVGGTWSGPGKHNNTCARVGPFSLAGSANLSTSTGGNHEWGHIVWLNAAGMSAVDQHELRVSAKAWPFGEKKGARKGVRPTDWDES